MTGQWRKLAARYDALTLRERAVVAAAAILGTVLLFYTFALEPLALQKKRLAQQLAETRQLIRAAEEAMRAQETPTDPDAVKRNYRDALRQQLAEFDRSMQGLQRGLVPPERMAKLLEEMLARSRGLQLVSLRTLPVRRFDQPGAALARPEAKGDPKPDAAEPERAIYQHSFELTLLGSYADIHEYLARLEKLPWQMFWGRISITAEQHPRLRATLVVQTLSLNKAWLIV
jgi:MSHA biogenesis protein MshJ